MVREALVLAVVASSSACATPPPASIGAAAPPPAALPAASLAEGAAEGDDPGWTTVSTAHAPTEPALAAPPLIAEATRQLRAMRTTRYRHRTTIDELEGTFEYDCSGFVAYALRNVAPDALLAIPIGPKGRPRAEDFAKAFGALPPSGPTGEPRPWTRVSRAIDARPGDVVAWLRPVDVEGTNTGHVAIVWGEPQGAEPSKAVRAIGGVAEVLVRIVDSTESPHADDVRAETDTTGLGLGTIGLVVDEDGRALGYRWRGGKSKKAYATAVAIARLVR